MYQAVSLPRRAKAARADEPDHPGRTGLLSKTDEDQEFD
jgi:hypothetical protein